MDDAHDALELINDIYERSTFADAKDYDETKKSDVLNPTPGNFFTENKKKENTVRRRIYEIGVHKEKYTTREKVSDVVEGNTDRHNVFPCVSGVVINTPVIQELENKGVLMKGKMKRGKEFLMEKTHAYLGPILGYSTMKYGATPYGDDVGALETRKTKGDNDISVVNNEKAVNDGISSNKNQGAEMKLLDEAVKDFDMGNINVTEYLSYGKRRTKSRPNPASDGEFRRHPLDHHEMQSHDIKTLGDALTYFDLASHLEHLETSLEDVRRKRKKMEDHADFFKQIDKDIQKLSFKYHPDRVKNDGGTEKQIATAHSLQTAINATRTVLKVLNSAFMEDIGTDHKFGFYTKLSISSVSNEDEIKSRIYEVIFKIGVVSRIKQQNIISEIRKFLIESKNCVDSYLGTRNDFEKYRDLALFHLKCCIKGFKKLRVELAEVEEQYKSEKDAENMLSFVQNMARDSKKDLCLLKSLKKTAKVSLDGKYKFFSPTESVDPYFVLPLIFYTNVILMCNVMVRNASIFDSFSIYSELDPKFRDDLGYLMHPYYLAAYYSGKKYYEKTVLKIMGKVQQFQQGSKLEISKEEIESEFFKLITQINHFMNYKFRVENYNEAITTNLLALDLTKCMTMMTEFQEKEEKLSKGIKEFQKKTEKMDEKYARFDQMMQESELLNQEVQERLKQSKKLSEKISSNFSEKP